MAPVTRMAARASLAAVTLTVLFACGALKTGADDPAADPAFGNGSPDGAPGSDAAVSATSDGATGGKPDAAAGDAATGDGGTSEPSRLDPGVAIPPLDQEVCSHPGRMNECPSLRPCRIATPDAGRCDDCVAQGTCTGGVKSVCQTNRDCDILFQCFRNRCTLFCSLPNGPECGGAPGTCIDVGHVTTGLCDPAKL